MSDQKSEIRPLEDPAASNLPPQKTDIPKADALKTATGSQTVWQRALRLFLGALIIFSLGAVTILFWQYLPARSQLEKTRQQLTTLQSGSATELQSARQEVENLSKQVGDMQELQNDLIRAALYTDVLEVQLDVANARLALTNKESSKARLFLSNTDQILKKIADNLPEEQRRAVTDLQARLRLAINAIGTKDDVALSDLELLASDLLELESAFRR